MNVFINLFLGTYDLLVFIKKNFGGGISNEPGALCGVQSEQNSFRPPGSYTAG